MRKRVPALALLSKERCEVLGIEQQRVIVLQRWSDDDQAYVVFNYASTRASIDLSLPRGKWRKALDSADPRWLGPGSALPPELDSDGLFTLSLNGRSFILLVNETKKI